MPKLHTIETKASAATSRVRALEFPALEEGNISFPDGRYLADFERLSTDSSRNGFRITHRVEGAPFIERLMSEEQAPTKVRYVCAVSSPFSSYRSTEMSDLARQEVTWDEDDMGEAPLFTPMIVVVRPFQHTFDRERDGVHPLWHGQTVEFEPGMRLALCSVVQLQSSVLQLLSFDEDDSLGRGQFRVEPDTDGDFRFRVRVASDLHRFLRYSVDPAKDHILTHVVSSCLAALKCDWSEDSDDEGWRTHRTLVALSEQLRSETGGVDWTDETFSPELAATKLLPHQIRDAPATEDAEE